MKSSKSLKKCFSCGKRAEIDLYLGRSYCKECFTKLMKKRLRKELKGWFDPKKPIVIKGEYSNVIKKLLQEMYEKELVFKAFKRGKSGQMNRIVIVPAETFVEIFLEELLKGRNPLKKIERIERKDGKIIKCFLEKELISLEEVYNLKVYNLEVYKIDRHWKREDLEGSKKNKGTIIKTKREKKRGSKKERKTEKKRIIGRKRTIGRRGRGRISKEIVEGFYEKHWNSVFAAVKSIEKLMKMKKSTKKIDKNRDN